MSLHPNPLIGIGLELIDTLWNVNKNITAMAVASDTN